MKKSRPIININAVQLLLYNLPILHNEIVTHRQRNAPQQVGVDGAFLEHAVEVAWVAMHLARQPRLATLLLSEPCLDGGPNIVFL